ncbi:transcriptional regulator with XRE-family HTH domain [Actinopolyspora biskrensis]|uniref:Transcriptional regulator with XRE-family HTH domain n=1 Tax=Actinopolyspora biskrensis TaxID=1470178 RepID=A0A852ZAS7_9ACTN|nr:helix-turn-helix transcriptional regulator [Actinopolyspora biskrensis]NYH79183.1 transcriptional regulator with XRE-family HTH domain [Actinopolyspora biskrensis]
MAGLNEAHTPKARLLGAELRELRKNAGFNGRQLAAKLGITQTTISRYERGARTPPVDYVARVLGLFGVTGQRYDELVEFAHSASEPNMITRSSIHRNLVEISEFERDASEIVYIAPLMIPGPLQTRAYAAAVMASLPPDERDLRIELRMARREALAEPRQITTYLAERVLRDQLGGFSVMAEQIEHLVKEASRPNVDIRVIPADQQRWTLAHDGSFVLYKFPKASPIVHLDHHGGPAFLYDQADVAIYADAVDTLPEVSMSPDESVGLMANMLEKMEGRSDATPY